MLKKIIKNNYKLVLGIITGLTLSTLVAYASTIYEGSVILYDNSNSSLSSTNVQGALDELYGICSGEKSLYNIMKSSAVMDNTSSTYVTSSSGINFSNGSSDTNGKGVYIRSGTESSSFPIYYYRGAVDNNNIIFANFCWKIVRTTETGGIKLIYNGTPSNGTCSNTGENSQIGTSVFNSSSNSPAYQGYMYGTVYTDSKKSMNSQTGTWYFGNGVGYSNNTYTLAGTKTIDVSKWSSNYNTLNNNHYTCFSAGTTCSTVYYIYYTDAGAATYISLTGGKKIEDALDEMLTNSSNTTNSTVKTAIDTWYETNMTAYTNYLEDTVWCNERSIGELYAFNPNGGDITVGRMDFLPTSSHIPRPNLKCRNSNDAFTVSSANGNGALTYPVSLLTSDEIMLAGGDSSYYLHTGQTWWTLSPFYFSFYLGAYFYQVRTESGSLGAYYVGDPVGVRPSVSLRHEVEISSGNGTSSTPYVLSP